MTTFRARSGRGMEIASLNSPKEVRFEEMNVIRWWDPAGELAQTHRMMDRLFDSFFGPGGSSQPETNGALPTFPMPVDILETEDGYVLEAAVPGFAPEKVEVTYAEGILSIEAQAERVNVNGTWLRRERPHGSFLRKLQLPSEVQGDKISASFDNGLLTITVPKAARPQPVKIPVSGSSQPQLVASKS